MPLQHYDLGIEEAGARIDAERVAPALHAALGTLPPAQRRAVELRVLDELPYAEVGRSLGCSPLAARIKVSRALGALSRDHGRSRHMTTDLQALGDDLFVALSRRAGTSAVVATGSVSPRSSSAPSGVFSATAIASGIADDLNLDPTQWSILGRGSVDNGKAEYVHGQRLSDGSHSTFLVEHDAGLAPYEAFLLHEKTLAAARATSPVPVSAESGALCSRAELQRAESVALATLRSAFPAGTDADATKATVDASVRAAFARRAVPRPRVRGRAGAVRVRGHSAGSDADAAAFADGQARSSSTGNAARPSMQSAAKSAAPTPPVKSE